MEGAKIFSFRKPTVGDDHKVRTINEPKGIAIENAIHEFGGNLLTAKSFGTAAPPFIVK